MEAPTTGIAAIPRADHLVQLLRRQADFGRRLSDADIARLLALEPAVVASLLRGLATANQVRRTADGHWELTPTARGRANRPASVVPRSASTTVSGRFSRRREVALR